MVKRRLIRILTPYSRTHYFIDKGVPRGIVHDSGIKLEEDINARLKTNLSNKVRSSPTSRFIPLSPYVKARASPRSSARAARNCSTCSIHSCARTVRALSTATCSRESTFKTSST
jgi:hypothetical protein